MGLKKRILWVEDCNESNGGVIEEDALKRNFLNNSGLNESIVEWADSLESAINLLNKEHIYDLVILDLDFKTQNYPNEFNGYISKEKYDDCQRISKENKIRKTGYLLFLYLIMKERFPLDRICFFSANIYEDDVLGNYDLLASENADNLSKNISRIRKEEIIKNDHTLTEKLTDIQRQIKDCLVNKIYDDNFFCELISNNHDLLENVTDIVNQQKMNTAEEKLYKSEFLNYKHHFEESGMIIPKNQLFGKPGSENSNIIRRFYKFTHKDEEYYQLKYCLVNMCDIIIDILKSEDSEDNCNVIINRNIYFTNNMKESNFKYQINNYIEMLESVKSRLVIFAPKNLKEERLILKNILLDITLFMEEAVNPKYNNIINEEGDFWISSQAVMKFLRNMLSHCKFKEEDVTVQFCAFIFGISMRGYFNNKLISSPEYINLENMLLDCISTNNNICTVDKKELKAIAWKIIDDQKNPKKTKKPSLLHSWSMHIES